MSFVSFDDLDHEFISYNDHGCTDTIPTRDKIKTDWHETGEAHIFKADMAGMKKEEVKVEVEDGKLLKISGDRSIMTSIENRSDKWHLFERSHGKLFRIFTLPQNVMLDDIKASMEDGVLTVIIPKLPQKKPHIITIPISG